MKFEMGHHSDDVLQLAMTVSKSTPTMWKCTRKRKVKNSYHTLCHI